MITDTMISSELVAKDMFNNHFASYAQFSKADSVKMGKKNYIWEITTIHIQGKIDATEALLRAYVENPHQTVEELIGDIQLILRDAKNRLKVMNPKVYSCGISLEQIMRDVDLAKMKHAEDNSPTISAVS
jgi:hypothetical protein